MLTVLLVALAVAVAVLLAAAPVLAIIRWWTSGRLDCLGAIALGLIALVLLAIALLGPALWVKGVGWAGLAIGGLYALGVWRSEGPAGHRAIDQRNVEHFAGMVRSHPDSIPYRVELAEALHRLGREAEAIQHLEYAVAMAADQSVVSDERRLLETWRQRRRERMGVKRRCTKCYQTDIDGRLDHCPKCGAPLTVGDEIADWVESGHAARVFKTLAGGLAIATAGFVVSRFVPGFVGGLVLFAGVAGGVVFVFARVPQSP
jgi:hypothetical protein